METQLKLNNTIHRLSGESPWTFDSKDMGWHILIAAFVLLASPMLSAEDKPVGAARISKAFEISLDGRFPISQELHYDSQKAAFFYYFCSKQFACIAELPIQFLSIREPDSSEQYIGESLFPSKDSSIVVLEVFRPDQDDANQSEQKMSSITSHTISANGILGFDSRAVIVACLRPGVRFSDIISQIDAFRLQADIAESRTEDQAAFMQRSLESFVKKELEKRE